MISEIQTINRLLASVNILEVGKWAKEGDVSEYYTTQYVYPVRDAFNNAEDFCIKSGLAESDRNRIRLTNLGRDYLVLGDNKAKVVILEPNKKQKDFLSRKIFLASKMLDPIKKILYHFNRSEEGKLQILKEQVITIEDQNLFELLLQLDILIDKVEYIEFASQYTEFLEGFISNNLLVVTPEDFEKSEAKKREISKIAEEYVLQSELIRLKGIGAIKQSKSIDHIATKNIAAGYDIASFDDQNSTRHDRFIEVKAGKLAPINFFLSRNEFETAKRIKEKYYIYYVCIKNKKPQELFIFSNPTETIMKDPKFTIHINTYEISEK